MCEDIFSLPYSKTICSYRGAEITTIKTISNHYISAMYAYVLKHRYQLLLSVNTSVNILVYILVNVKTFGILTIIKVSNEVML